MKSRSKFSLSNYKLLSCDMGELVPIGLTEVLPGDSIQQATNALVRASALLSPVMHTVHVRIHHWFVPHRIVWEDFEDFITGGPDGMDASVFPTIDLGEGGAAVGSLADYLGVPTGVADLEVSALPFRGYAMIFNEWYRDQDLVTKVALDISGGPDAVTNTTLQKCAWEKDYFTSARLDPQKGPDITIPLGTAALVKTSRTSEAAGNELSIMDGNDTTRQLLPFGTALYRGNAAGVDANRIFADLSDASAITVTALREALALQRFEEARSMYGSRYVEYLKYLGVTSSDARLQRPEYLGGGSNPLQFSEVLQTAEGTNAVGTMRGHGISTLRSNRFRRFFEEHGYIHTFLSIRPKTIYGNALFRTWNRRTKEDFWQKELEHVGQQEVLKKEVYGAHSDPDGVFGYQDRYDEYRRSESNIAGEFRTSDLNFWHMARIFGSDPTLNSDFVTCVPTERTFAVPSKDVFYIMAKHSIQARRLVSQVAKPFIY